MRGWLLNLCYVLLLAAVAPVLAYRAWRLGKYRQGWGEKLFGIGESRTSTGPCLWLHAVSVGEVLLLQNIVADLRQRRPDIEVWLSTTTHTGHAVAREKFPDCRVVYFPLDFTWAVNAALDRIRPDVVGLVELELWPNFITAVARRSTPLLLINGRLGERSYRGYRRVRFLMRHVLGGFTALGMQTPEYARRIVDLGAPAERVTVTGSVKFDGARLKHDPTAVAQLRDQLGICAADRVLVAGSTHAPEEEAILESYADLTREHPNLRLLIAPRHQERFEDVAALIESRGWQLQRRSDCACGTPHPDPLPRLPSSQTSEGFAGERGKVTEERRGAVILLDTLGELSACWPLAEVAFVGGSLSKRGGQNMLEPCAAGAAVIVGPNTWNFKHAVELLTAAGGLTTIKTRDELPVAIRRLLTDPFHAKSMRTAARRAIASQQGATRATVELLLESMPKAQAGNLANRQAA